MLQLLISGEAVDLSPDATITIDEESPVFDRDSIPGGFSFPFNLPVTLRNRRILGFPERIEKSGAMSTEQPFQLFHQGLLRAIGTITVTEASDIYKAHLIVGSGDLASKIKDKKLKDIDFGGERTWEWKPEYKYPNDDFALAPISNVKFYLETKYASFFTLGGYLINGFANGAFYTTVDVFAICPLPFLSYILKQIFLTNGFMVKESVLASDPDFRDLVLYTIRDITMIEYTYEYGMINGQGRALSTYDLAESMPDMLVSDFLLSIRNFLNIAYVFEGDSVRIIKRQDKLLSPMAIDITDQAVGIPKVVSTVSDGFKLELTIDDNDDLWSEDFYNRVEDYLKYVKDPVASITALATIEPLANEIRYIQDIDLYYRYVWFQYDPDDTSLYRWQWVSWSYNFQNFLSGNSGEVFTTKVCPVLTVETAQLGAVIKCPFVEQKGSYREETEVPPFALRLLFYRGLIKDSMGDDYPFATNDNLDRSGALLTGKNLTLNFAGDYGIYEQLWKKYLTWWMSRKLIYWTITDPSALSFAEKYAIEGNHYLLNKRTINLTQRGVEPGECEFYLV